MFHNFFFFIWLNVDFTGVVSTASLINKSDEQFMFVAMINCLPFQSESDVASYMKKMLVGLGFPKPPENITAFQLFSKLEAKVGS